MPSCPTDTLPGQYGLAELTLPKEELLTPGRLSSLIEAVRLVPDPRTKRLVTHPMPILLGLAAAAKLCGIRSVRGMIRWASGQGAGILAALEVPDGDAVRLPVATTVTRAFARIDGDAFDDALSAFMQAVATDPLAAVVGPAPVKHIAADGKTVCGAVDADGRQLHLLAAYQSDPGIVLAQRAMRAKGSETVHFTAVLDQVPDLAGAIVTMDALHTVAAHADYLHARDAYGIFIAKGNRPKLFAALDTLDWDPAADHVSTCTTDEHHGGRHEMRTVHVQPLSPGTVPFPHARQAILIERTTTGRGDGKIHAIAELGVSTAPPEVADADVISACVRAQWGIESLHFLRDTAYREDDSTARTSTLPRVLASLNSLAIGLAHLAGWRSIAAAHDHYRNHPDQALHLLGLTS